MTNFLNFPCQAGTVQDWADYYQHQWQKTDSHVLLNGKLIARDSAEWQEAAQKIFKNGRVSGDWRYDKDGFTDYSSKRWTILKPTHQREATGHHYLEVVTAQMGKFGSGRHAFFRLEDDQGATTSVGFCGAVDYPFSWRKGILTSPDPRELKTDRHRTTRIQLTQEQYQKLKTRIETDKAENKEAFHLFERNCASYVAEVLRDELGLEIDNREYPTQALFRNFLLFIKAKKDDLAHPKTLKVIHAVSAFFRFVLSPFYALAWLGSGSAVTLKEGKEAYRMTMKDRPTKSIGEKLKSFFRVDYVRISTGWRISVWQDMAAKMGSVLTLEEARSIQLGRHTEVPQKLGAAFQPTSFKQLYDRIKTRMNETE